MAKKQTIEINQIGPIESLSIPLPTDGGVVVLTGRNGSGKSLALGAVSFLAGNKKAKPNKKDDADKGLIAGFNAKITVGSKVTATGNIEGYCDNLEATFSISDLVDPGIANPDAADKVRIKALVAARGVEANPELFRVLFPDEDTFNSIVSSETLKIDDATDMAGKMKREVEAAAREKEKTAADLRNKQQATADVMSFNPDDIIPNIDDFIKSGGDLAEELVSVKTLLAEYKQQMDFAAVIRSKHSPEAVSLQESLVARFAAEANEAKTEMEKREALIAEVNTDIGKLEFQLERRKQQLSTYKTKRDGLKELWDAKTEAHDGAVVMLDKMAEDIAKAMEADNLTPVTQAEVDAVQKDLDEYNDRLVRHRMAIEKREASKSVTDLESLAVEADNEAKALRTIAKQCEEVLSTLIGDGSVLWVEEGRIKVKLPRRGATFYSELSHGERWSYAFRAVADAVKKNKLNYGMIVLPQEAWESLDPDNRKLVGELARKYKICVITAQNSDGELRQEVIE